MSISSIFTSDTSLQDTLVLFRGGFVFLTLGSSREQDAFMELAYMKDHHGSGIIAHFSSLLVLSPSFTKLF